MGAAAGSSAIEQETNFPAGGHGRMVTQSIRAHVDVVAASALKGVVVEEPAKLAGALLLVGALEAVGEYDEAARLEQRARQMLVYQPRVLIVVEDLHARAGENGRVVEVPCHERSKAQGMEQRKAVDRPA